MFNAGDLALRKPATLVKTYGGNITGRLSKYAVDGDISTSNLDRCASADDRNISNWLQVDLLAQYAIANVILYAPGKRIINSVATLFLRCVSLLLFSVK